MQGTERDSRQQNGMVARPNKKAKTWKGSTGLAAQITRSMMDSAHLVLTCFRSLAAVQPAIIFISASTVEMETNESFPPSFQSNRFVLPKGRLT